MFLISVLFFGSVAEYPQVIAPQSKLKNFQFHAPLATAHCAIATDEVEKKKKKT